VSETVKPGVETFFEERTDTVSYLVWDPGSKQSVVIDPVLDFDPRNGRVSVKSADAILAAAENAGLKIIRVLETHAHADHLSAAPYIKQKTGATVGIGEHIRDVQWIFGPIFNATDIS
jgi:glyoxylase-like metal-dependent hydrolase (beta-lactamase superfamily II)